jgi:hypothetical protein
MLNVDTFYYKSPQCKDAKFLYVLVEMTNNMHRFFTAALFHIPTPTCFGSSLPSSGSFWIRPRYMKIQISLVVYHIMLVKWPVYRSVVVKLQYVLFDGSYML